MKKPEWNWPTTVCALYLISCAVVDLLPRFGAPYFRYTGSDPAIHVWNLGWPLAVAIFDPRSGFHIGPFAIPVLGIQLFVFGVAATVYLMIRKRQDQQIHPIAGKPGSG